MFRLSFIVSVILFVSANYLFGQSPHGDDLKFDCSACHNSSNWKVDFSKSNFNHDETGFNLMGQHKLVDCKSCHANLVFSKTEPECNSCHTDIHQESVGLDCSRCHTSNSWIVEDINRIHQERRFPLLGNHLLADCAQCHSGYSNLYFEPINVDCYDCHEKDYNATTFPNHSTAGFSTDCEMCHSINADGWTATSIIHDFFPLVGGHAIQDCFTCHKQGGDFTGLSQECYSCHQGDYENVQDPNHVQNNFPTDCKQCHTIMGWSPATFDHNQTAFPLTGKHTTVSCSNCHTNGYANTPTDCYSCHQADYQSVSDPNHIANNFPTDCSQCHNTNGWGDATFDHSQTSFPLTGKHTTTNCIDCHSTGYTNTPTDCYSCHQANYQSANDPNHVANNFPTDCSQCHNTNGWGDAVFDHSQTSFPLTGTHTTTNCIDCHSNGYTNTPTDCYSCHSANYNSTTDPNHQSLGYPTTCGDCHSTTDWTGATFDHSQTSFPLTGTHTTTNCIDCHSNGYTNTPTDCYSCHSANYNSTTDPNHQSLGFPTTCEDCHSTTDWTGATFDHSIYVLSGNHLSMACNECHSEANYQPQCLSCHTNDFLGGHRQGDPTDCWNCHSTSRWENGNDPLKIKNLRE
jgi:hypothetical protein